MREEKPATYSIPEPKRPVQIPNKISTVWDPVRRSLSLDGVLSGRRCWVIVNGELIKVGFNGYAERAVVIVDEWQSSVEVRRDKM